MRNQPAFPLLSWSSFCFLSVKLREPSLDGHTLIEDWGYLGRLEEGQLAGRMGKASRIALIDRNEACTKANVGGVVIRVLKCTLLSQELKIFPKWMYH